MKKLFGTFFASTLVALLISTTAKAQDFPNLETAEIFCKQLPSSGRSGLYFVVVGTELNRLVASTYFSRSSSDIRPSLVKKLGVARRPGSTNDVEMIYINSASKFKLFVYKGSGDLDRDGLLDMKVGSNKIVRDMSCDILRQDNR